MSAFILDVFVFLEVVVIAASLIWISRTTESQSVRAILPMVTGLLLIITLVSLPEIKGDGDGLYAIGLITAVTGGVIVALGLFAVIWNVVGAVIAPQGLGGSQH